MTGVFIGVDVGTGSARAGVFDETGVLLGAARRAIRLWQDRDAFVEQSSADIWAAVCASVREAMRLSGAETSSVRGIGFDATCSLVVLDPQGRSLAVGPSGDPQRDVIVWMDHRAIDQTRRINETRHPVLTYVGGFISPEMQTPKLLWLKEERPQTFAAAGHFFDLADFLSFKATGSRQRSVCTVTCKWTYLAHERRWDGDYFRTIGLAELADENFQRIGQEIVDIATPLGSGLTEASAAELGLLPGTPVGASLIDAHAGGVGTLGGARRQGGIPHPGSEAALIMGTSSCVMASTAEPVFVDGLWGPYFASMLPGQWLVEGGQSAYGAALDYLVAMHPAFPEAREAAAREGVSVLDLLERRAIEAAGSIEAASRLAGDIHVVPEFLGNRSPDADPKATAAIAGLTLATSPESLVRLFVAGLCGLCYGTRQIVATARGKGVAIDAIVVSGGASRSPLLRRILSDSTGLKVALPETTEPVLLGSAMVGAVAGGAFPDLTKAASRMCRTVDEIAPNEGAITGFHAAKFAVFDMLQKTERAIRRTMRDA